MADDEEDVLTAHETGELLLAKAMAGEAMITNTEELPPLSPAILRALRPLGGQTARHTYRITISTMTPVKRLTPDERFQTAERLASKYVALTEELAGKASTSEETLRDLASELAQRLNQLGRLDTELAARARRHGLKLTKS